MLCYDITCSDHPGQIIPTSDGSNHLHEMNTWIHEKEFVFTELKDSITKQYKVEKFIPLDEWELATTPEERKEKFGYLESDCEIQIEAWRGGSDSDSYDGYCLSDDWGTVRLLGWRGNGELRTGPYIIEGISNVLYRYNIYDGWETSCTRIISSSAGDEVSFEFNNLKEAYHQNQDIIREAYAQLFETFYPQIDQLLNGE